MNNTIAVGTQFEVLLGMPRVGTITRIVGKRVYYNVTAANGEIIPQVTTRATLNSVMVAILN
jgi:hypothetical protein